MSARIPKLEAKSARRGSQFALPWMRGHAHNWLFRKPAGARLFRPFSTAETSPSQKDEMGMTNVIRLWRDE